MSKFSKGDVVRVVSLQHNPYNLHGIVNIGDMGIVDKAGNVVTYVLFVDGNVYAFANQSLVHAVQQRQLPKPSINPLSGSSSKNAAWKLRPDPDADERLTAVPSAVDLKNHVQIVDWMMRSMDTATIHAVLGELNKRLGMTSSREYKPDTAKDGKTVSDITKDLCGRR